MTSYYGHGRKPIKISHLPMPEHVDDGTVMVDVCGKPDELGRVRFFAYWAQDIRWRGGGLVAGQVFCTSLDDFTTRENEHGRQVVIMNGDADA